MTARRVLLALALCLVVPACKTAEPAPPPDWNELGPVVDVHCHVFNGRDLPIAEWLRKVMHVPRLLGGFVEWVVDRNAEDQPPPPRRRGARPLAKLEAFVGRPPTVVDAAHPTEAELDRLVELYERIVQDEERRKELETMTTDGPVEITEVPGPKAIREILTWALLLTWKRQHIATSLSSAYGHTSLFTPSIVDMNFWFVDQDPGSIAWSLAEQEGDMAKLVDSSARMLPFLAFDPERERQRRANAGAEPLVDVLRHLAAEGFVGVKIYPPFGYRPSSNATIAADHRCAVGRIPAERRRTYDTILEELYVACVELDLPIAAHCEDPGAGPKQCGEHADPRWWAPVLAAHPTLRLNLTHFGGVEGLVGCEREKSWAWAIGDLMKTAPRLYADVGAHEVTRDADMCDVFLERLAADLPHARDRLMFGTDWHMIVRHDKPREYADRYLGAWVRAFSLPSARRFARQNALDYLGLSLGPARGKNRDRLEALFLRKNWTLPAWIQ